MPGRSAYWRRRALALAAFVVAIAAVVALVTRLTDGSGPDEALDGFLTAWSRGDDRGAAARTDAPPAAQRALIASRRGLDGASLRATRVSMEEDGGRATARVRLEWRVPAIGSWRYETVVRLRERGDDWKVTWAPNVVHPRLNGSERLGTVREPAHRGEIRGRDGAPLVTERAVVTVGIVRARARSGIGEAAGAIAGALDVDEARLVRAARRAKREQFVPAITVRAQDFQRVEARLRPVPGVVFQAGKAPLAPSRSFARALLGGVGPATAEQLERLGPGYGPGDQVGQWGLQARFEHRLAGTSTRRIVVRAGGAPTETLYRRRGRAGRTVRTTIDPRVQRAAESALGRRRDEAALVAIQPSTGNVLAVANRPTESTYDRALVGLYPPGSTFKVISTAALLRDGLDVGDQVSCPRTIDVGGKSFRNFEGSAAGAVPFSQDFAQSCNTAFVSLAGRLPRDALARAALDFGLGRDFRFPIEAAGGKVPPGRDRVARAATMIGQDRIVASPLAMAGVAATVAAGRWRAPRLLESDPRPAGRPLPDEQLATLRELMRAVVVSGTGTALATIPGEVSGKSGTAEFGGGDPPPTHAWFIAFRGDLAVSVLVEHGESGGRVAAPIAARFFSASG
jgi:cell division protein FtsI/penicillin-binding protein 2